MNNIDITPVEEETPIEIKVDLNKEIKKAKKIDSKVEDKRFDELLKELNAIKDMIASQSKVFSEIIERSNNIEENQRSHQIPVSDKIINETPQPSPIKKQKSKKLTFLKLLIFPLLFIVSSFAGYMIIHNYFEADFTTEVGFTIGVGILFTLIILAIYGLIKKLSGSDKAFGKDFKDNPDHELAEIKVCPLCKEKVAKSKVFQFENNYRQIIKCVNPMCDFKKDINIGI